MSLRVSYQELEDDGTALAEVGDRVGGSSDAVRTRAGGCGVAHGAYVAVAERILGGIARLAERVEDGFTRVLRAHGEAAHDIAADLRTADESLAIDTAGSAGERPLIRLEGTSRLAPADRRRPSGPAAGRRLEPTDLTTKQQLNLTRFRGKIPRGPDGSRALVEVYATDHGTAHYFARVPGRVPGSAATYNKLVDSDGVTLDVWKDTFAPGGRLVHRKDKT